MLKTNLESGSKGNWIHQDTKGKVGKGTVLAVCGRKRDYQETKWWVDRGGRHLLVRSVLCGELRKGSPFLLGFVVSWRQEGNALTHTLRGHGGGHVR